MIVAFKGSFHRDASNLNDRLVKNAAREVVLRVKAASHISQIQHLVKLRQFNVHYRIEIVGNYRIGIIIRNNKVWFVRLLHQSKIYREFP